MIRAILCLLLTFASTLTIFPIIPQHTDLQPSYPHLASLINPDPNGAKTAFNVTYTHFDLYTRTNTTLATSDPTPPGTATWSSKFTNSTGSPVRDTAFRYRLPAATSMTQSINYTLNIPRGANLTDTFLTFKWNGSLGTGTTAQYRVYNGTGTTAKLIFRAANITKAGPLNFTGGPPVNATGRNPFSCSSSEECLRVTGLIGFNLTLAFLFTSTASGNATDVDVQNVIIASIGTAPAESVSHTMALNANQTQVQHTTQLSLTYNATVTYPRPNSSGQIVHKWRQILATFFFPTTYTLDTITLDSTPLIPGTTPIIQGACLPSRCTNASFISLNMTTPATALSTVEIKTTSINALDTSSIQPILAGVPTDRWMPGDIISIRMKSRPGLNVSAAQTIFLSDPQSITQATQSFTNKGGTYLYDLTIPVSAPLGSWNVTATFLSGYDFGQQNHPITLEKIKMESLTMTGTAGQGGTLTVQGKLAYASNSAPAGGINATVFIVDAGAPPGPTFAKYAGVAPTGLYVSNITLANGVFTRDQPLIIFFTVANPTPTNAFNASITIEHEWYSALGGDHGVLATFPLELGDQPFLSPTSLYRLDVTLTVSGVHVTVQSVAYNQKETRLLSPGTSGVPVSRQHFGSFKISITSKTTAGSPTTNFLNSPTYAYLLNSPLLPSRMLAFSTTVTTTSTGDFSVTILSEKILGAKTLTAFALARDATGIALGQDQPKTVRDSTFLAPTAEIPGEVTRSQSVKIPLSITSNSTLFPITLTVNLDLSGLGTLATRTFTVQPNSTHTENFDLTAPSTAGSYLLTFSSPQYGPLLTKTLQVSILPGSLQVLIPAIIGLVAAIVILGVYLVRKRPEAETEEEVKPKSGPTKPSKPQSSRNP